MKFAHAIATMIAAFITGHPCVCPAEATEPRMVFAHYMVCMPPPGGVSVESYRKEMLQASSYGIDGWALHCDTWSSEPHYKQRTLLIYEAAKGTEFKLFMSSGVSNKIDETDIVDMIRTGVSFPNQLIYNGKVFFSTFTGAQFDWKGKVFAPLKQDGIDVYFVPFFYPEKGVGRNIEVPDTNMRTELIEKWKGTVDGLFCFGAAVLPEDMVKINEGYARELAHEDMCYMASWTPHYQGLAQPTRRYFETRGGEGTVLVWESIIEKANPPLVEIVTWNDWNESSWVSPNENTLGEEGRHSHIGYIELAKYYIEWYKTGAHPPIEEEMLFWFHRTHPKDLTAPGDTPVTEIHGDIENVIYITTMLKEAATLHVKSGDKTFTVTAEPGIKHHRFPFAPGRPTFELSRKGAPFITTEGAEIQASITKYDFVPASGFAIAAPR